MSSLRSPELAPLPIAEAERAAADAVKFLLSSQRKDGSFISPSEVRRASQQKAPNPFTDAVTAICGQSLLQRLDTPGCQRSAERAMEFLLKSFDRGRRHPAKRSYMDYTVWSKTFVVWFFADCVVAKLGDGDRLREVIGELVEDLRDLQKPTGGWSYHVTGDLSSQENSPQSISFVTAPVLLALLRARDAGVGVPTALIDAAAGSLAATRVGSGAFAYFLHEGGRKTVRGIGGAAGRGPICELALLRAGRSDTKRLARVLDTFLKHRASLAKEVGKVLMHAGPDGQGCHYPMFDYGFAAIAVAALPANQRERYRQPLLELMLAARSAEGAYRDAQFNGWEYGTAMALMLFRALDLGSVR